MSAPLVHQLFHAPIADHSFSADRRMLAVTRENTVELYQDFRLQDELRGHDKTVTGVDIAPRSGRIVTCSQDRNAYVWEPNSNGRYRTTVICIHHQPNEHANTSPGTGWKPTLVLLRLNRAATCVRWSPSETKFAVGSGARAIAVCYFEEDNDWWVSKHVKKPLRSTVTAVAWHPNSVLLAAGSTDAHARVFSAFIKGGDARPDPGVWGERLPFNTVCGEFLNPAAGWVHGVAFSPSGDALAFCAHDSSITVVYPSGAEMPPKAVIHVATQLLPFTSLLWTSETELVGAGYDCGVYRFSGDVDGGWRLVGALEGKDGGKGGEIREESALNMFRSMDLKGRAGGGADDTKLRTVHQNGINMVRSFEERGGRVGKISTGGVDGRVVVWTL